MAAVRLTNAIVPQLWFTEIVNGLVTAERRGRLTPVQVVEGLHLLRSLPLTIDESPSLAGCEVVLKFMREHRLTAYDATYLALATHRDLPLGTLDNALRQAATTVGISLLPVPA